MPEVSLPKDSSPSMPQPGLRGDIEEEEACEECTGHEMFPFEQLVWHPERRY
ncbi:MAG: hypothetical protein QXU82_02805 [Candidatus Aenigmatarchaeota archaeon]